MASLTFLPEADSVRERWDWATDVLTSWNGSEARLSLMPRPKISQTCTFKAVTPDERRKLWMHLTQLDTAVALPLWGWGARVTASAASGTADVYFDTVLSQVAVGDRLILINTETGETQDGTIDTVNDATNVTLTDDLTADITPAWTAFKGMTAVMANNTKLSWAQVSGRFSMTTDSFIEPSVQRTNTAASLTEFNSLPVLERLALAGAQEDFEYPRSITDFGLGGRNIGTRHEHLKIVLRRRYLVNRATDTADVDYWRLFLDTVRGNWRAFLMSTQLEDMTLVSGLSQGGSSMTINEEAHAEFHAFDTFKNFEITYSDGTTSWHTISSSASNGVVSFSPALPNDAKVANVDRISYLLKVRMADRLEWTHGPLKSIIAFDVRTTDDS